MLIRFLPVLLTVAAQSSSWLRGLDTTLRNIGCQDFAVAISSSTPVIRNDSTIYCPTSFAVSESERAERIAYHIVSGSLNSTDIARPRQQTIALTELIQDNRLQALILETAPSGDSILARGSDWNVSSVGMQVVYEGIKIQPMNQAFALPQLPSTVISHALHSTAPSGASEFLALVSSLGLTDYMGSCRGCTFLVPNNDAVRAANLAQFNSTQQQAIIRNHILREIIAYTPTLTSGQLLITEGGRALAYGFNSTNAFLTGNGAVSVILRSNIVTRSGVVHLVNTVIPDTQTNDNLAASIASSRSAVMATQTTVSGIVGRPVTYAASATPTSSSSAARLRYGLFQI